ncbi:MAG TPA: accessory factor UbiK family protein, partial [Zeimonas sp.]
MNTTPQSLLAELQQRVSELFRNSPAADIERNLKAMLAQTFQRVELVTRDEFDAQLERLSRLQERIATLERRLDAEAPGADTAAGGAAQAGTTDAEGTASAGAAAAGVAGAGAAGAGGSGAGAAE